MLSPVDIKNLQDSLKEIYDQKLESILSLVVLERQATDTQISQWGDQSPYNVWADDKGYTETESVINIPCRLVPSVNSVNLTQVGYKDGSDIEIEISYVDVIRFGLDWTNIQTTYDYVRLKQSSSVSANGRISFDDSTIWDIVSVRPLYIGDLLFLLRIGLKKRELEEN